MGLPDASGAYCMTTRLCFGKTRTSSASTETRCVGMTCTGQPEASWVSAAMRDAIPAPVDSSMTPYLQHLCSKHVLTPHSHRVAVGSLKLWDGRGVPTPPSATLAP